MWAPRQLRLPVRLTAILLLLVINPDGAAQLLVSDTSVGYIDPAAPFSHIRFRYDSAYSASFLDRAEFAYGTWQGAVAGAPGLRLQEREVDYQELGAYLEYAPTDCFSVFADLPVRLLNPDINENTGGYSDMTAGLKWALARNDCCVTTFQFKTYIPTGDADRGLGTDHVSLEPGLLVHRRITDQVTFEGELRDWIPVGGTPGFAGNVLRYGAGLSFPAYESCSSSIRPVAEVVGWTVLDGQKTSVNGVFSAEGDSVVNLKLGVRANLACLEPTISEGYSLYVGYGRALTGDVWYKDILRAEIRLHF